MLQQFSRQHPTLTLTIPFTVYHLFRLIVTFDLCFVFEFTFVHASLRMRVPLRVTVELSTRPCLSRAPQPVRDIFVCVCLACLSSHYHVALSEYNTGNTSLEFWRTMWTIYSLREPTFWWLVEMERLVKRILLLMICYP